MFNQGVPVTRWRDSRNNPDINENYYKSIYEKTLEAFDQLFAKKLILPIAEQSVQDVTTTAHGSKELKSLFGALQIFDYRKSSKLIKYLIDQVETENSIILDFFVALVQQHMLY